MKQSEDMISTPCITSVISPDTHTVTQSPNIHNQDNMLPPEPIQQAIKCNISEEQDTDFKITTMNMFNVLEVDRNP